MEIAPVLSGQKSQRSINKTTVVALRRILHYTKVMTAVRRIVQIAHLSRAMASASTKKSDTRICR